jgi:tRNA/rRNA methyltransferase
MAGSDPTSDPTPGGPAIVLVAPQLAENIGAAARAMLNGGLTDLRLVRPRPEWPNERALAAASGADSVIAGARLYGSVAEATADLSHLYASTARRRDMVKPVVTPREAAAQMRLLAPAGTSCGVLFGPERTGLDNDDVAVADVILTVPLNPAYASLNLGQAVMLVAYEWYQSGLPAVPSEPAVSKAPTATKAQLHELFQHLEDELDANRFLQLPHMRPVMVRNLRNILSRAGLTAQEVKTLHGVITALVRRKWQRQAEDAPDEPEGEA